MRLPHLARVMGGAAAAWNFRWGPFGIQTEHEVRTLPPVSFRWHTHEAITRAALDVLPAGDLAVLGPEAELLASAYRESLKLAAENNLTSISFPSISTGVYGYPVDEASRVALRTTASFLGKTTSIRNVIFVLFDSRTFEAYSSALREIRPPQN